MERILLIIWWSLLALTAITIGVAQVPLGFGNIAAAFGIATFKASLVIFFFMDLRHEERLFRNILVVAMIVFGIFLGLIYFDVGYRY
jgi:cytochrome c oxidase subunit IV